MKTIPLSQNQFAMVDDDDFQLLKDFKWTALKHGNTFYAGRFEAIGKGKRRLVRMHRFIMGAKEEETVDHIDRNGLNNTKENLRMVTSSQNAWNRAKGKNGSSPYKGVSFHKDTGKYVARIMIEGKAKSLGYFDNPEEASVAYEKAADEYFGSYKPKNSII